MCQFLLSSILFCFVTLQITSSLFVRVTKSNKSRLAPSMNVIVVAMVVAVALSSTLGYSEALIDGDITNEDLCQEIKWNKRRILTMGARGKSQDDAHFYMLVTGGYMFKVPLSKLYVDVNQKAATLTLDQDYIRANELLNVNASLFSSVYSSSYRFFLFTDRQNDAFLGRMFPSLQSKGTFQLFNLTGVRSPLQDHPQVVDKISYAAVDVFGSIGIDSSTYGFQMIDKQLKRGVLYMDHADELVWYEKPFFSQYMMDFYSNTPLVAAFYHMHEPNKEPGYYFFLDADGLITVTRRENAEEWSYQGFASQGSISDSYTHRFEVSLSAFVVCDYQASTKSDTQSSTSINESPNWVNQVTNATAQNGSTGTYHPDWALPLGIGLLVIVVLGGITLYWTMRRYRKKKNKKDKKNRPRDDSVLSTLGSSNISSNVNSSNVNSSNASSSKCSSFTLVSNPSATSSSLPSSASSALHSPKSKIASLLKGNRSKVAKAVTKQKNSKVKSKKPNKSKVNKNKSPKLP